jgi:hypothetical protein
LLLLVADADADADACVRCVAPQDAGTQKDFFLDVQSFKELKE